MQLTEVYLGIGGNIGDSYTILNQALQQIKILGEVQDLAISRFYLTSPVSKIPQDEYVNAACRFKTSLNARELLLQLQKIETGLGKAPPKLKDAPRTIDLDILLFGLETYQDKDLIIPHPRWKERLFVLVPLIDLTSELTFPDPDSSSGTTTINLQDYLHTFANPNKETVLLLHNKEQS